MVKPQGKLRPRVHGKRYAAHFGQLRYWADVHDERGLFMGRGTYASRAEAMAAAWSMIVDVEREHRRV